MASNLTPDQALALAEAETIRRERERAKGADVGAVDGLLPIPEDSGSPMTLSERAKEVVGLDPDVERLTLLPYPKGALKKGADIDWLDWVAPQIVADMVKSAILPGHVVQGGDYNVEDVVKFTLDYAIPGAQARFKPKPASNKEVQITAPAIEELQKIGSKQFKLAEKSGVQLTDDGVSDLLTRLKAKADDLGLATEGGLDRHLYPNSAAGLQYALSRLTKSGDMKSLMLARQNLSTAARKIDPDDKDDARIARALIEELDDFVEKWLSTPAVARPEVADMLKSGRAIWGRMKRTEIVEEVIQNAQLAASGIEAGLKQGFRSLLKNKKRMRGFNDQDKKLMERIVEGGTLEKLMGLIGKFSFGSGIIGGSIGSTLGFLAAGLPGAIGAAAGTQAARGISSTATGRQANLVRALVAHGNRPGGFVARRPVASPLAAALIPPEPSAVPDSRGKPFDPRTGQGYI
jgi:hypothetical protein